MSNQLRARMISWRLWLRSQNKSPETVLTYLAAVELFVDFLECPPDTLDADLAALLEGLAANDAEDIRSEGLTAGQTIARSACMR